jgi:hypothetical protein
MAGGGGVIRLPLQACWVRRRWPVGDRCRCRPHDVGRAVDGGGSRTCRHAGRFGDFVGAGESALREMAERCEAIRDCSRSLEVCCLAASVEA